jgi:hypothetical protein
MPDMTTKAQLMPPPVDFNTINELIAHGPPPRNPRAIFVDTRDANVKVFNAALAAMNRRGEKFELITIGPVEELSPDQPRLTLSENDEIGHVKAMLRCGIFVSVKDGCPCDYRAIRALAAGCWPVLPNSGCYSELIPQKIHGHTLYDGSGMDLAHRIQDVWHLEQPQGYEDEQASILSQFDPMYACKAIDERLEQLVQSQQQPVAK